MVDIRHILCPVDFSEFSHRALVHAVALAKWYQAELTVLHVVPVLQAPVAPAGSGATVGRTLMPPTRDDIAEQLRRSLELAGAAGIQVHLAVQEGETARRVLEHAAAIGAHLVVMGTHGRSGIDGLLLGSMAAKVVWAAPCPVMTVPHLAAPESSGPVLFKKILCAIDFSPSSLSALNVALSPGTGSERQGHAASRDRSFC